MFTLQCSHNGIGAGCYPVGRLFALQVRVLHTALVEYLYQTKDTESHEDSDFCYDWGTKYDKLRELWRTNRNR